MNFVLTCVFTLGSLYLVLVCVCLCWLGWLFFVVVIWICINLFMICLVLRWFGGYCFDLFGLWFVYLFVRFVFTCWDLFVVVVLLFVSCLVMVDSWLIVLMFLIYLMLSCIFLFGWIWLFGFAFVLSFTLGGLVFVRLVYLVR